MLILSSGSRLEFDCITFFSSLSSPETSDYDWVEVVPSAIGSIGLVNLTSASLNTLSLVPISLNSIVILL